MRRRKRSALDERVNLRLPAQVKSRVEQVAEAEDRTLTSMIRRLVVLGLDALEGSSERQHARG